MGTNYYMITNKKMAETYFPGEYTILQNPKRYRIHIGKRSASWKPLFEEHKNAYPSVKELLLFLEKNNKKIKIQEEEFEFLTIKELQHDLIEWEKNQTGPVKDHVVVSSKHPDKYIKYFHDPENFDFVNQRFG